MIDYFHKEQLNKAKALFMQGCSFKEVKEQTRCDTLDLLMMVNDLAMKGKLDKPITEIMKDKEGEQYYF